jgi:5-(carboxyamino)imidazole ribonucleotide mutase
MAKLKTKNSKLQNPLVGIIMGSDSDLHVMRDAANMLKEFDILFELTIVSAHRTPLRLVKYATTAVERGLKVIIAGAGGAAHLPGMIASMTTLPVIGVPIKSSNSIDGWDSILSILQMPNGVPVATVALNASKNAGIIAAQIIGTSDKRISEEISRYKIQLEKSVLDKAKNIANEWQNDFDET